MGSRFRLLQQLQQRAVGTTLRQVAAPISLPDIHSIAGRLFARQLVAAMERERGVGLAAPQVGRSWRMFAAQLDQGYDHGAEDDDDAAKASSRSSVNRRRSSSSSAGRARPTPSVIVNPRILWSSPTLQRGVEGCLSLPGLVAEVPRAAAIRVSYTCGLTGSLVEAHELRGFRARIFQHELDHLNGVLFLDRLEDPSLLFTEEAFDHVQKL